MADPSVPAPWQLMRLLDGYLTTQMLFVVAKLGVADVLSDGPLPVAEIADRVGARPDVLRRLLRGLVLDGVFVEHVDGQFGLAPIGEWLTTLGGAALVRGELYYAAAGALYDTTIGQSVAFQQAYGEPFFEHLEHHDVRAAAFRSSMAGRSEQEAQAVVAAYDFAGVERIVDVGGGRGVLLAAILATNDSMRGVLFDRDAAVEDGLGFLNATGLADRVEGVTGDFFDAVPTGADAYLLSRVLHDWDDVDAARVLVTCRAAMGPGSRLLVVDAILPEVAIDGPAAIRMDLHMLVLFGTRERSEAELRALLEANGFAVQRVLATASPAGLGVIEAVPTDGPATSAIPRAGDRV
jgi:hypothetical protein